MKEESIKSINNNKQTTKFNTSVTHNTDVIHDNLLIKNSLFVTIQYSTQQSAHYINKADSKHSFI